MATSNLATRRSEKRLPIAMVASIKNGRGGSTTATVENLSASGCTVLSDASFLEIGANVAVKMAGLEGLTGTVRWVRGPKAGVHFDQPLYAAVLEHLAQHNPRYGS